jgi:DNA-binding response OmpR family regulator
MTATTQKIAALRVLVVEDHAASRTALVRLLQYMGFEVSSCANVAQGMQLLASSPDVLILDLMLPDGNGTQILRHLRQQNMQTSVAVVSGAGDEMLMEATLLKPDALFGKPIDLPDFKDWLAQQVRRLRAGESSE